MSGTRVIDSDERDEERWIDSESEIDDREVDGDEGSGGRGRWDEDDDEPIAPRPHGRLLRPLPLTLIAVTITAAGFLGGVEAQKGSGASSEGGLGGGALPAFAAAKAAGATAGAGGSEPGGGAPSFGKGNAAATGTVTSVEGQTIYVKEADGTVVAVKAADGSTVTRNANVSARKVHPGDSVVVEGSKHGSTVQASSIAATETGVESTTGGGTSVESLFGE